MEYMDGKNVKKILQIISWIVIFSLMKVLISINVIPKTKLVYVTFFIICMIIIYLIEWFMGNTTRND